MKISKVFMALAAVLLLIVCCSATGCITLDEPIVGGWIAPTESGEDIICLICTAYGMGQIQVINSEGMLAYPIVWMKKNSEQFPDSQYYKVYCPSNKDEINFDMILSPQSESNAAIGLWPSKQSTVLAFKKASEKDGKFYS